jgi:hypothetical protein
MSGETIAVADAGLDAKIVTGTTYYLGLHTGNPGITGASEVSGGSYARQSIVFGTAAAAGLKASTTAQSFTGMPACTVTYLCLWTTLSGATPVWSGILDTALTIPVGSTVNFAAGAVTGADS